jgi:hypothetical protein
MMIAAMMNVPETRDSILVVVIEKENLNRMSTGDPATLESLSKGGILPPPMFPLNLSMLVAYEEDETELYIKAQGDKIKFLQWLERGRKFIKGKDGVENTLQITPSEIEKINEELLAACKQALGALEENWAINWDDLRRAIDRAEEMKRCQAKSK